MSLKKYPIENRKSTIEEIYNLIPIINLLDVATKNTLVVFDIDEVLITPSSEDDVRHPYRSQLLQSILNYIDPQKIPLLKSSIFVNSKHILVESRITEIFENLKLYKIPAIALTAMGTGKFGIVNKMHEFRVEQLDSFNLSFKHLTPIDDEHVILKLAKINKSLDTPCKGSPRLKSGIIFTSGVDKGMVLEYIFKKYNYYPKAMIFIDDLIENVESLQQTCLKLNIKFHGFHYKAAALMPWPTIDEDLEKLRFAILEKEFAWLSHEQLKQKQYS